MCVGGGWVGRARACTAKAASIPQLRCAGSVAVWCDTAAQASATTVGSTQSPLLRLLLLLLLSTIPTCDAVHCDAAARLLGGLLLQVFKYGGDSQGLLRCV